MIIINFNISIFTRIFKLFVLVFANYHLKNNVTQKINISIKNSNF